MSDIQVICHLCDMLNQAQSIIREQAALLAMNGIETEDGGLEAQRQRFLTEVENEGGYDKP